MDVNLTGTVAANTIQSGYSGYIIAAAGVIVGATITSGLTLLRDILNRKQDRNDIHTSSVKTSMHRIGLLSFLRSIFAEKARAYREPFSTNSSFWLNSKVQNEIII